MFPIIGKASCVKRLIHIYSIACYIFLCYVLIYIAFVLYKPPMQHIGIGFSPTLITVGKTFVRSMRMIDFSRIKKRGMRRFVPGKNIVDIMIISRIRTGNLYRLFFGSERSRYSMYPLYRYYGIIVPLLTEFYLQFFILRTFNVFTVATFKFDIRSSVPQGFVFLKV